MEEASRTEILDPEGDAILVVIDEKTQVSKRFLISSKNLRLASPYFEKLFSPAFQEGSRVQNSNKAEIILHDDNMEAMEIILSLLHFKHPVGVFDIEESALIALAKQSDKYQCNRALGSWIRFWLREPEKRCSSPEDYGWLFTAALLFQSYEDMQAISAGVIRRLKPDFDKKWSEFEEMLIVPTAIIDAIKCEMSQFKDEVVSMITKEAMRMRKNDSIWAYKAERICKCESDSCTECQLKTTYNLHCDTHVRFDEYFEFMNQNSMWPNFDYSMSLADVKSSLKDAWYVPSHKCADQYDCGLHDAFTDLAMSVIDGMKKIEGLEVEKIKSLLMDEE